MENEVSRALFLTALGSLMLRYIQSLDSDLLVSATESEAVQLLEEIRAILNDRSLDDPTCFRRIDRLADAFHDRNLPVSRHDF